MKLDCSFLRYGNAFWLVLGYEALSLYFNNKMLVGGISSCWMSFCIIANLSVLAVVFTHLVGKMETIYISETTLLLGGVTIVLTVLTIFVENSNLELLVLNSLLIFLIMVVCVSKYIDIVCIFSFLIQIHSAVSIVCYLYVVICNGTIPIDENTVGFSLALSLGCIVTLNDIQCKPNSKYKAVRYVYVLFMITGLFYIKSRIGIIAVIMVLLLFAKKKSFRLLLCVCIMGVLMLFYGKKESTLGRCFIYSTSVKMIVENPSLALIGGGKGYFEKNYMLNQAKALEHADMDVKKRADNIRHPLNEFLLVTIDYGGVICLSAILCLYYLVKETESGILRWSVMIIAIFACFSYPFKYPISWIALAFALSSIVDKSRGRVCNCSVYILGIVPMCLLIMSVVITNRYFTWRKAYDYAEVGDIHKAEYYYSLLREKLNADDMFMYNYAHFLLMNKKNDQALETVEEITINDYDAELLKGELYRIQEKYHEAIVHYTMAHRMCPNRIIPVYALYMIYKSKNDIRKQKYWGVKATTMPLKVPSREVEYMKLQIRKEIGI